MSVSLMNLLGGNLNPSASMGLEGPGKPSLGANGEAVFETVMATEGLKAISAEALQAFFASHGLPMNSKANAVAAEKAQALLAQLNNADAGQNLPGGLLGLQEVLPAEVVTSIEQALFEMNAELKGLVAQLPKRELTPEELSEIVQKTGLAPHVVFEALQDTPAASPNLAAAMVEDMGAAEGGAMEFRKHGLQMPAPAPAAQQNAEMPKIMPQNPEPPKTMPDVPAPKILPDVAQDGKASAEQRQVLAQIIRVLAGEKQADIPNMNATTPTPAAQAKEAAKPVPAPLLPNVQPHATGKGGVVDPAPTMNAHSGAAEEFQATAAQQGSASATKAAQPSPAGSELGQLNSSTSLNSQGSVPEAANVLRFNEVAAETRPGEFAKQVPQQAKAGSVAEQVSVRLHQAVADGGSKMEIKLHPAELGKVEVRIETAAEGHSRIHVVADKRDTLDMLVRDARALEQALRDVGIKTDSNSLSFNLRGDGQQQAKSEQHGQGEHPAGEQSNAPDGEEGLDDKLSQSEMALTYDAGLSYRLSIDWGVDISA